jgi:lysophospholipase L1-like esterase
LHVSRKGKWVTTNEEGLRETGANPNDADLIRIVLLGGSTTFGTGVTDTDSWPYQLQSILGDRFSVLNYGVPGYSTVENIIQMALQVPEVKPHFVVFYVGWNDIRNYHDPNSRADYEGHGIFQITSLKIREFSFGEEPLVDRLLARSGIFEIASWLVRKIGLDKRPDPRKLPTGKTVPDPEIDRIYQRNLQTLRLLTEHIGAVPIFVPQVLNRNAYRGKTTSRDWTPYIVDRALPDLMLRFNGLLDGVCGDSKACYVVVEIDDLTWKDSDFVDAGHLSAQGGNRFASILSEVIVEMADK